MGELLTAFLNWLTDQGTPVWIVLSAIGLAALPIFLVLRGSRIVHDKDVEQRRLSADTELAFARTNAVSAALTVEIARLNVEIAKLTADRDRGWNLARAVWEIAYKFRRMLLVAGVLPVPPLPPLENILIAPPPDTGVAK